MKDGPEVCSNEPVRVLIVEDVAAFRLLLRLSLERRRAAVREAESLSSARHVLRTGYRPDHVLLDLELGDGVGLDLIREISDSTSVHLLTADTTHETRLRASQAGCASIVDKSQDVSRFLDTLIHRNAEPESSKRAANDGQMDRRYLEFLAESRIKLSASEGAENRSPLRSLAHRISGTAVHFGYQGLGDSAQALSRALRKHDEQAVERALGELDRRIGEALEAFHFRQQLTPQEEYAL